MFSPAEPTTTQVLREMQAASPVERREASQQLKAQDTPGSLGVRAAQELLQWLEDHVPCLDYRQRVTLVTGGGLKDKASLERVELIETLATWWCKQDEQDETALQMELLILQGNLPTVSRRLLQRVQKRVDTWRLDQRLPRLRAYTNSLQEIKRWAVENGKELDFELDAAAAAEMTGALAGLAADLHDGEPMVFGVVDPHEARLWLLCSDWVIKGKGRLNPRDASLDALEREAARLLAKCLRLNVNHPDQIEAEMKRRLGIWDGNPNAIIQDSRGRWFWGDGTPAIPQADGSFIRERSGFGGIFDDVTKEEIWAEIGRCFKRKQNEAEDKKTAD